MEFLKNKGWRGAGLLALSLLLASGIAFGQAQSGNIYVKVSDDQAAALPGVSTTLTGVGAPITQVTNVNGEVRFVHLSPASYTLDFSLQGFAKLTRKNIIVALNENTQVNVTMKLAGVQESVVVTGESPLLDKRSTGTMEQVSKVELESIPTARDPWVILQSSPGVMIDRVNVGGADSGQQSTYVAKGTDGFQGTWNVDGVNITDMGALGSSPMYYDFDSFAEMNITTGGSDASIMTAGVQMNMVTKRGTNDVHGSVRVIGTDKKLQSTNIQPELEAQLIRTHKAAISNQIQSIQDYGAEVGGPVIKDKLWLWGSYGRNNINNLTAGGVPDSTILEDFGGKLNASFMPENTFTAVYAYADKRKAGRSASPTRPLETTYTQSGPTKLYKVEDSHIFSSDVFATATYSRVIGGFGFTTPGTTQAYRDEVSWHNSYALYNTYRPQTQVTAVPSFFLRTGSVGHEIKLGFNYRSTPIDSTSTWQQGIYAYSAGYWGADPPNDVYGAAVFTRQRSVKSSENTYSGFLSDTMTMGKLTINLGVRYDYQSGANLGTTVACCDFSSTTWPQIPLGPLTVDGTGNLIWRDFSPRVGITYALGDQGKTLLKASFGRFVNQLGSSQVTWNGNAPYGVSALYYYWNDKNGNGKVETGEVLFDQGIIGNSYVDPANPNKSTAINSTDPALKSPKTNEFILGIEHELMPAFVVGLTGTFRRMDNYLYTPGLNDVTGKILTSADFDCVPAGPYPVPNGTPQMVNNCGLKKGIASTSQYLTNRTGYYQQYWGLDFTATKRYSDKWMARFAFSYNDWKQKGLAAGQSDPANLNTNYNQVAGSETEGGLVSWSPAGISGAQDYVYINARWVTSVTGMYTLPLDFNISTSLFGREGYPVPYYKGINNSGPTQSSGSKPYTLGNVGDYRVPSVFEWDMGLSKVIAVGPLNVTLMADCFNILNRNTVLQRTTNIFDAAGSTTASNVNDNNIFAQQNPRIWRFGARLSF
jgi:hypothetical protein